MRKEERGGERVREKVRKREGRMERWRGGKVRERM